MKKLFIVASFTFLFVQTSLAQADTLAAHTDTVSNQYDTIPGLTVFAQVQYQRTYYVPKFKTSQSEFLEQYPWAWINFGKKAGAFLFLSSEGDGVTGISTGPYFSFGQKVYNEIGIGGGAEISNAPTTPTILYLWGYYYFENKPDVRLAKNKVIIQLQYAYSKEWDTQHWMMGSLTWTPFQKFIGIGFWGQTETSWGGKIVGNLPLGKSAVLSTWVGGGIDHKLTWGTDFIVQVTGKSKLKKKK